MLREIHLIELLLIAVCTNEIVHFVSRGLNKNLGEHSLLNSLQDNGSMTNPG
jgi:hypothetical protein